MRAYRLIREILDHMPTGDLSVRVPRRIPAGETVSRVEAPRGELFYYIKSNGSDRPERIKVRTPSLCNWASVIQVAVGQKLADMPMILSGIDPCFSCNDRMVSINRGRTTRCGPGKSCGATESNITRTMNNLTVPPLIALLLFPGGLFLMVSGLAL